MSNEHQPNGSARVGVVGAGQLARMMGEAAHDVGVRVTVLATSREDSAVATSDAVQVDPLTGAARPAQTDVLKYQLEAGMVKRVSQPGSAPVSAHPKAAGAQTRRHHGKGKGSGG